MYRDALTNVKSQGLILVFCKFIRDLPSLFTSFFQIHRTRNQQGSVPDFDEGQIM